MLRTLLMTIDFPPRRGGVARYLDRFASYFADRIFVLADKDVEDGQFDAGQPYKIERTNIQFKFFRPRWMKAVFTLISRKNDYDQVLISHVLPLGTAAWIANMISRKPYIVIVHGMDIRLAERSPVKRWLCRHVLQGAKLVITNSNALKTEVEKKFALKQVIVSYPCFEKKETKRVAHEGINLLTVSRLVSRKGHLRTIQALDRLFKKRPDATITYHVVGSGPERERIQKELYERKLEDHVIFHSNCSNKALEEIYASTDIFVMPVQNHPTDKEGFGMVYMEAAQYGVPSIATKMSGVDEAVIDQETGILIPDGDIDALENALNTLIDDKELRSKMGTKAMKRVNDAFSPKSQLEPLKKYL